MNQPLNILTPLIEEILGRHYITVKPHLIAEHEHRLPAAWTVKQFHMHKHRKAPMEEASFYIACENNVSESSFKELREAVNTVLSSTQPTIEGLVTLLFFINAVGFVHDEERNQLEYEVCDSLPSHVYQAVVEQLIDILSEGYHFASGNTLDGELFLKYEKLNFTLQYVDRLESPVWLLVRLLRHRLPELPVLPLVARMSPEVKVSVFEFRFNYTLPFDDFLAFLRDCPEEAAFWATLVIRPECGIQPLYNQEVMDYFVVERWPDIGRHLMLRNYQGKAQLRMDESLHLLLTKALDRHMAPFFFEDKWVNTLLHSELSLDSELRSFANWLSQRENFSTTDLNQSTMNALHGILIHHLGLLANGAAFVSRKQDIYNAWFSDIYDVASQMTVALLHVSMLRVSLGDWEKSKKAFAKVCYTMRVYFYGSFTPSNNAKQICSHLLTLLFGYPILDEGEQLPLERITNCANIFTEQVLFHWVHLSEREDIIWDKAPKGMWNVELAFLLDRFSQVPELYKDCFTNFFTKLDEFRSTDWAIR